MMTFNNQVQFNDYAQDRMSEIEKLLSDVGFSDDDIIDVIEAVEQKVAQSIKQKSPDFNKENIYFDDVFLCINGCFFKAEWQEENETMPAEMTWPDISSTDKALADIGLGLEIDWDLGVDYVEDLDEYGDYDRYIGDIKAILELVDASKFMKFVKSLHGAIDEDSKVDLPESKLDLNDDLDMENVHSTAHADQNLKSFLSVFFDNEVSIRNPVIEIVAKALQKSIDAAKLKKFIQQLKSLGVSHPSFKKVVSSLDSLAYFVKCMDEFDSKTSLAGFEDDTY